jgi:hypothetical protein
MFQASGNSGIKTTIRFTQAENSNWQTVYISLDRKRMEFRNSAGEKKADGAPQLIYGPRLVAITRCDLGQNFELNLDASEYTAAPYPPKPLTQEQIEARGLRTPATTKKPTLRLEVSTTDTGERKQMFGRIARHVITMRKQTPLEGSRAEPQETVTDAWYIDLHPRLSCDPNRSERKNSHAYTLFTSSKRSMEKVELIATGKPETGFALHSLTTWKTSYAMPVGTSKQIESKSEVLVTQWRKGLSIPRSSKSLRGSGMCNTSNGIQCPRRLPAEWRISGSD